VNAFIYSLLGVVLIAMPRFIFAESGVEVFQDCRFVSSEWADGDSFPVRLPDGRELTVRLYGVDCIETAAANETLARRLRAQRRYFGIEGGDGIDSGATARMLGVEAAIRTASLLAEPFSVETSFTDARGSGMSQRVYGYVTLQDGRDLGSVLVREGLARAFGVVRSRADGTPGEEYRQRLADFELVAAGSRRGAWAKTDWSKLAADRALERDEAHELAALMGKSPPVAGVDPNTASASMLETLPGIGPVLAGRIIEERDVGAFLTADDLRKVKGISDGVLERISTHLRFDEAERQNIATPVGTGGISNQRASD
jgi:endonuclease YncB( thermonuclease family)